MLFEVVSYAFRLYIFSVRRFPVSFSDKATYALCQVRLGGIQLQTVSIVTTRYVEGRWHSTESENMLRRPFFYCYTLIFSYAIFFCLYFIAYFYVFMCACVCVCLCARARLCVSVCICVYVNISNIYIIPIIHICIYMYTYTHACTYIRMYI